MTMTTTANEDNDDDAAITTAMTTAMTMTEINPFRLLAHFRPRAMEGKRILSETGTSTAFGDLRVCGGDYP